MKDKIIRWWKHNIVRTTQRKLAWLKLKWRMRQARKLRDSMLYSSDKEFLLGEMRKMFKFKQQIQRIDPELYEEAVEVLESMYHDDKYLRSMYLYYLPRMGQKRRAVFRRSP